ncbi:MAG: thiamine phosphate synthase, partial [Pyrinomonadaceae bacterium]
RRLLGESAVIGFSTHSVEQAREASLLPVDYVAVGPVFDTSSKENPDPTVGLEGLRRVRAAVGSIPLVAIGGITRANALAAGAAGADAVAVIGALASGDPSEMARRAREFFS